MQMPEKTVAVRLPRAPGVRAGALLAVALAAFFVVWLVMRHGNESTTPRATTGAVSASEADLKHLAGSLSYPVYWAGPKSGTTYELTHLADGRVYIRYLASANELGDTHPNYLTVGTYPRQHGFAELQRAARRPGAVKYRLAHGGLVYFNRGLPTNVYFSFRGAHYQVEVFDPTARVARNLVLGGKIRPIR